MNKLLLSCLLVGVFAPVAAPTAAETCTVIGHRGASGYMPEHTLEAYLLAMRQGADYIEPDLVLTSDGVPIARHENELSLTTDVADRPEFAGRKKTLSFGDREVSGWFAEDFTLAEIKTLRATERFPELRPDNLRWSGQFEVPTLQEVIDLVNSYNETNGSSVGLYPEIKQAEWLAEQDLDITAAVLGILADNGYTSPQDPVLIQSFEAATLRRAAGLTELRLVQLLGEPAVATAGDAVVFPELPVIAEYADGVGAPKSAFNDTSDPAVNLLAFSDAAHGYELFVHLYTFREANAFVSPEFRSAGDEAEDGYLEEEVMYFLQQGMDGFFIDEPDIGRAVCDAFLAEKLVAAETAATDDE